MLQELPTAIIYRGERARPLEDGNVSRLAASMKEIGLINPIMVRAARRIHGGIMRDVYEIIAGCHRYEAAVSLGWEAIPCKLVDDMDDLKVELAEIDENLIRANLSKAQEAIAVHRRKQIYEAMHPETKHGAVGNGREKSRNSCDSTLEPARFTEATAKAIGKSERTVQLAAEAGKKLGADLHDIAGTSLDNVRDLQALTQMSAEQRAPLIEKAKAGEKVRARKQDVSRSGERKASKIDHDVKDRAANECAQIIAEYVPADAWDALKANLYAAGAKNVANALTNITGQSIMDRRFA